MMRILLHSGFSAEELFWNSASRSLGSDSYPVLGHVSFILKKNNLLVFKTPRTEPVNNKKEKRDTDIGDEERKILDQIEDGNPSQINEENHNDVVEGNEENNENNENINNLNCVSAFWITCDPKPKNLMLL